MQCDMSAAEAGAPAASSREWLVQCWEALLARTVASLQARPPYATCHHVRAFLTCLLFQCATCHSGILQAQQLHTFATKECTDDLQGEAWRQICAAVARFIAADRCYQDRSESGVVCILLRRTTRCEI